MFKITDYFYTFSKLITSFILLGFLTVFGYALYTSYKDVDENAINLDQKFSNVTKEINLNSAKFLKIALITFSHEKIRSSTACISAIIFLSFGIIAVDVLSPFGISSKRNLLIFLIIYFSDKFLYCL